MQASTTVPPLPVQPGNASMTRWPRFLVMARMAAQPGLRLCRPAATPGDWSRSGRGQVVATLTRSDAADPVATVLKETARETYWAPGH